MCVQTRTYTYTHTHTHTLLSLVVFGGHVSQKCLNDVYIYIYIYIYIMMYICISLWAYIHMHTYINTYMHTYTSQSGSLWWSRVSKVSQRCIHIQHVFSYLEYAHDWGDAASTYLWYVCILFLYMCVCIFKNVFVRICILTDNTSLGVGRYTRLWMTLMCAHIHTYIHTYIYTCAHTYTHTTLLLRWGDVYQTLYGTDTFI